MKRKAIFIIVSLVIVAIGTDIVYALHWRSQKKITQFPKNQISCLLVWGSWYGQTGPVGDHCSVHTADAGKSCISSAECQTDCIYTYSDLGDPTGSKGDSEHHALESTLTHGHCDSGIEVNDCVGFFEGKPSGISCF